MFESAAVASLPYAARATRDIVTIAAGLLLMAALLTLFSDVSSPSSVARDAAVWLGLPNDWIISTAAWIWERRDVLAGAGALLGVAAGLTLASVGHRSEHSDSYVSLAFAVALLVECEAQGSAITLLLLPGLVLIARARLGSEMSLDDVLMVVVHQLLFVAYPVIRVLATATGGPGQRTVLTRNDDEDGPSGAAPASVPTSLGA